MATIQHAKNLACFALVYKSLCMVLHKVCGRSHPVHNFVAGLAGGYIVFGTNNKVNMQVTSMITIIIITPLINRLIYIYYRVLWLD